LLVGLKTHAPDLIAAARASATTDTPNSGKVPSASKVNRRNTNA
jgi:hypothetical protein